MRLRIAFALCVFLGTAGLAGAVEEGFDSLFNGKNLTGWTVEHGEAGTFSVQKDVLYCPGVTGYPAWLRSEKVYENFDLRFEFRMDGWCNSGVFFHAPLHGRNSKVGFEFQIDHKSEEGLLKKSAGALFDVLPPKVMAIGPDKSWNQGRILMDWPRLTCWINDRVVQELNVEEHPELKHRLRKGYLGLQDMGYKVWYQNIRIKELPSKEKWQSLFNGENFDGWYQEGKGAVWKVIDGAMHTAGGTSYMVTNGEYENFEFQSYVRTSANANGGIFVRWKQLEGGDRGNEIQVENTPDSNFPTGSLYNIIRAPMFHYENEEWFLIQIKIVGSRLVVRVNGETVVETDEFPTVRKGHISLQMHSHDPWIEFKDLKIKTL
ncbi:MAG: DUF1080 domain-containing protein [Candidatus Hinthialibacter antarcticus]|nr:DUF1080 domain-containing protein [Candidatus Hinthialibacter antarcticus]